MTVITKIEVQQKNKHRFNIYTEKNGKEEYLFSVSEDVLVKFQLKKGLELDELLLAELIFNEEIQQAYNRALQYLSFRMRSEKETVQYLKEKGIEEEIIQEVLSRLRSRNYVNDRQYAEAYVKTAVHTTDKGPNIIRLELSEKGIPSKWIDYYLEGFTEEVQLEKAMKLAGKFKKKRKSSSNRQLQQELQAMLLRKGYSSDIARKAIGEMEKDLDDAGEWNALLVQGEKAWRKYASDPSGKGVLKMKQFLFRKGFSPDLIQRFLREKNLED